MAAPDPVLA